MVLQTGLLLRRCVISARVCTPHGRRSGSRYMQGMAVAAFRGTACVAKAGPKVVAALTGFPASSAEQYSPAVRVGPQTKVTPHGIKRESSGCQHARRDDLGDVRMYIHVGTYVRV